MILCISYLKFIVAVLWIQCVKCMSIQSKKQSYFMDDGGANNDVVEMIMSKGYIPEEKYLPKSSVVKSVDNDVTYLLSKLSDEELIKLLNEQPKKNEYDLNDIVRLALDNKYVRDNNLAPNFTANKPKNVNNNGLEVSKDAKRFRTVSQKDKPQIALFRLENKQVDPYSIKDDVDPNYNAVQKLNNILYSRPLETEKEDKSVDDEEKKELLFDVLVSQLKTLCCKKSKPSVKRNPKKYQFINDFLPVSSLQNTNEHNHKVLTNEHMFLIINDEIKTNGSEEIISVDPDSLERNSSVLLLGPITTPLTDGQLKLVMNRISNELSKPEYIPLLQQISDGTLQGGNIKLMKSLVTGPETRRYIKPHRCNHQSKLARIYGGPKWLICTGYLNINTPSLYDRK